MENDSPSVGAEQPCRLGAAQLGDTQAAATDAGMGLGILHDLAVGVHPEGADAWALPDVLARGVTVGAPPDQFTQKGQNWSQPPWRPDRLAEQGYAPFRDMVRTVLRAAGGVRVDHVESSGVSDSPQVGDVLHVTSFVELGGLAPADVDVQVVLASPMAWRAALLSVVVSALSCVVLLLAAWQRRCPWLAATLLAARDPREQALAADLAALRQRLAGHDVLAAFLQVALDHQTNDGVVALEDLVGHVLQHQRLQGRVLVGVGVAAIHHDIRYNFRLCQFLFTYGNAY